jgi:hypothetical protein
MLPFSAEDFHDVLFFPDTITLLKFPTIPELVPANPNCPDGLLSRGNYAKWA